MAGRTKIAKAECSGKGGNEVFNLNDAEPHPVLSKDKESRVQSLGGKRSFSLKDLPRRILSYEKIVKGERSGKGEKKSVLSTYRDSLL